MSTTTPPLGIGLPVFNGENYLEETLVSLLSQTYSDFELVISDNASTDGTEDLCRAYAARDKRIKYYRNSRNIGATQNWYRVFDLSCTEYFAPAAHDDLYAPDYMEKCIAVLEQDPSVVVCYSKTRVIDEHGKMVLEGRLPAVFETAINTVSESPAERLYNVINVDYLCVQMYGVMRAQALRDTKTYIGYYGSDRNTLAELALMGKIYEIPEYLFFHRIHPEALGGLVYSDRSIQELFAKDPGTNWNERFVAPRIYRNYFSSVAASSIPFAEKIKCYIQLQRIIVDKVAGRVRRRLNKRRLK